MADQGQSLQALLQHFAAHPDVKIGNMFGFPCLTVRRKVFAVSFNGDMVFKLNEESLSKALALDGAELWNPYGHVKKQWVQIPAAHGSVWPEFASSANDYVLSLVK